MGKKKDTSSNQNINIKRDDFWDTSVLQPDGSLIPMTEYIFLNPEELEFQKAYHDRDFEKAADLVTEIT